ncbi:TonB-dependent receptor [Cellulophaga sp. F20128]|uniref:SusC/RagA family TonB-linked outer membrane protein n=1 Tax=Cellulophaga sp. F20128 TaxID=2926413 RepID=UPI001FF58EF6|nr:TonB-dependent receptor [Cellulophaga sp. F20128]MCK0158293.1 TonB-dependent receptor [Cellulophaga sp. F20128]
MKKSLMIATFFWSFLSLCAQEKQITGRVTDEFNEPLFGVNILVKGTNNGTMTGFDGDYLIKNASVNDTLQFTFVGMEPQLIAVNNRNVINVVMRGDASELEGTVVTAFGDIQKKESVVASIQTIRPSELKIPSSNLSTALAGRIAGLISYQRSGEPGADGADFFIRGVTSFGYAAGPLILIDGVESPVSELNSLQPDDIDTFSIMKDAAATAVYGARGGNGVINVTTKTGVEGKLKINIRHEQSFSSATDQINLANPITYMKLHNEASLARDPFGGRFYSLEKIEQTEKGANPFVYPATDWYNLLFKDNVRNSRTNFNLSGGSPKVTYYLAATFNEDNGNIKVPNENDFNNNINVKTFVLRSNVGLQLTKTTKATIRFTGQFRDYNGPLVSGSDVYGSVLRADPVAFVPFFNSNALTSPRNHILFGNDPAENFVNPYAETVKGFRESTDTQMKTQVVINQDFNFVTEGLTGRFLFSTDRASTFNAERQYNPFYYNVAPGSYNPTDDTFFLLPINAEQGTEFLDFSTDPEKRTISASNYFEMVMNYNKKYGERHSLAGMLVATRRNSQKPGNTLSTSLPSRNSGYAGRFSYGLNSKYFTELSFGINGSERFAKNHRWGFFPSGGFGYMISKEKFWESSPLLHKVITSMKLRATYGLSGTDAIDDGSDRFFYLSDINLIDNNRGYAFGEFGDVFSPGVSTNRNPNNLITWETSKKLNLGIEATVFDKFNVIAEYFTERRDNILQARSTVPVTLGLQNTPIANVGKAKGSGVDLSLDYNNSWHNGLWLSLRGNFTYARTKFAFYEDVDRSETPWLNRTGLSTSQTLGYVAERLFIDQADVDNSPIQNFSTYGPGDIKYRDINNDGVIGFDDQVPIGNPTRPEIIYGFGFSAGYKGFDISAFFQGLANESFFINTSMIQPFIRNQGGKNALLQVIADDHWSESNPDPKAFWPRLTDQSLENNEITSTWWMRDGSFLRLKTLEIGYNFPEKITEKLGLGSARFYATGVNLLTLSKFKLWDPELAGNGFGYPIQKVFNLGLKVGL